MPILNITLWKLPSASNILNCWDGNCRKIRHRKVVKSESFSFRWWSHSGGIFTKRIFQLQFFRCDSNPPALASCRLMTHKTSISIKVVLQRRSIFQLSLIMLMMLFYPMRLQMWRCVKISWFPRRYKFILFLSLSPQLSLKLGRNTIVLLIDTK